MPSQIGPQGGGDECFGLGKRMEGGEDPYQIATQDEEEEEASCLCGASLQIFPRDFFWENPNFPPSPMPSSTSTTTYMRKD